jgi:hypothetical protein
MRINAPPAMASATQGDARTGAHADVDLGAGLRARVRLSLTDAEARAASPALVALRQLVADLRDAHGTPKDR